MDITTTTANRGDRSGLGLLNSNVLKIIALITMTCDHVGILFWPFISDGLYEVLRALGRLSFPIFAFFIAEGCRYTRNKWRYLGIIVAFAAVFQIVFYLFAGGSLMMSIFFTFALSICVIYAWQLFEKNLTEKMPIWKKLLSLLPFLCAVTLAWGICNHLSLVPALSDFVVDYGFWGVMLPFAAILLARHRWLRLLPIAVVLVLLAESMWPMQYVSMCALVLLALYNGERGRLKLKYLFYIYYPLHLVLLEGLYMLIAG